MLVGFNGDVGSASSAFPKETRSRGRTATGPLRTGFDCAREVANCPVVDVAGWWCRPPAPLRRSARNNPLFADQATPLVEVDVRRPGLVLRDGQEVFLGAGIQPPLDETAGSLWCGLLTYRASDRFGCARGVCL